MKDELFYGRARTEKFTVVELKTTIFRYFISYWNIRRICSAHGGLPSIIKWQRFYEAKVKAA